MLSVSVASSSSACTRWSSGPGPDPEELAQPAGDFAVRRQRESVPSGRVLGAHQLGPEPFARRVALDELGQLRDHRGRVAEREPGIERRLPRLQVLLDQPRDHLAGQRAGVQPGQRFAAPEGEPLGQERDLPGRITGLPGTADQGPERLEIELLRVRMQRVASVTGADHRPVGVPECGPQPGDVDLQGGARAARQLVVVPQDVDEILGPHGPVET
ncbi:hypothetical protein GCM10009743_43550 [Kribbella swartbergensis]